MVVDDDNTSRTIAMRALKICGYLENSIALVENAAKALSTMDERTFNLILLDVHMDGMSGVELLQMIRNRPDGKDIPVIMVSASEDLMTVYKCIQEGADDYIFKPVRPSVIKNLWSNMWRKKKEREIVQQLAKEQENVSRKENELALLNDKLENMNQKVHEAVLTPISVIIKTISDLTKLSNIGPEVRDALGIVLTELSSSNLYRPAINRVLNGTDESSLEGIDSNFIRSWLLKEYGSFPSQPTSSSSSSSSSSSQSTSPTTSSPSSAVLASLSLNASASQGTEKSSSGESKSVVAEPLDLAPLASLSASSYAHIPPLSSLEDKTKQSLESFEFDLWRLDSEDSLIPMLEHFFVHFRLHEEFAFDLAKLRAFIVRARVVYKANTPYHTFRHAFDVTQTLFSLLTTGGAKEHLSPIEIFSLLIAGIGHDVGHPGLSNPFLIATNDPLALLYNDVSVLESYHAATTFKLLALPECNILSSLSPAQYRELRGHIIRNILATDMSRHMEIVNRLQATKSSLNFSLPETRQLFMQILIKTADISNPAKPFTICRYWAELVQEEFFLQGDREAQLKLQYNPMNDREKQNLPALQIGFANLFVFPLFTLLAEVLPGVTPLLDQLHQNRLTWEKLSQETKKN
eukprot:CAMPEP_0184335358 /NCGR_PEP_ID=MMETSP1089-20130417/3926_1 /TAXON_ID=38269 ORGANISM="Gloeochaete wittrockiana, Strain SAG46.84" /NCGR_SAMPLE_ID=MMETSP1089 /ASSEMBLY_ACC=CAM_ASM_000445 /LENGTH=633 /DNA_ID=CAMNT_0026659971 /DNA_START=231 /DNA_END=2132 /DNA_ORIENTATION=+